MATVAALVEKVRLIGLSLHNSAKKGDVRGVAKWAHQLAATAADLAVVADPAAPLVIVTPKPADVEVPVAGLRNWDAAQADAGFVLGASLGDTVGADTNPAPGAALKLGFSGVVGYGTGGNVVYGTFVDGTLIGSSAENPGAGPAGFTTPFGLAPGIDPDGPYTGPGAVRP